MPFPNISACLLCEVARPELNGKFILLGYYGLAPHVRIAIGDFAQPIQLCFVFAGGPGHGHFRVGLRIASPNGQTFDAPGVEGDLHAQAPQTNLFMGFLGVLPGPGNYSATLLVNDVANFHTQFTLEPKVLGLGVGTPN